MLEQKCAYVRIDLNKKRNIPNQWTTDAQRNWNVGDRVARDLGSSGLGVAIAHAGEAHRLRLTRQNKLILTTQPISASKPKKKFCSCGGLPGCTHFA